jgi:hypothetical protein
MINSNEKVAAYSTIQNLVEDFLNKDFEEKVETEKIIVLSDKGISITIDLSKFKA